MRISVAAIAGLACFGVLVFLRPEVEDAGLFQSAEIKEWSTAQTVALISDNTDPLVAFLRNNPDSKYRDDALMVIEAMLTKETGAANDTVMVTRRATDPLGFSAINDEVALTSATLDTLFDGQPLFAPVNGLPQSVWADKSCSDCHQWSALDFCDQAQTYTQASFSLDGRSEHPFGHDFILQMRDWAYDDCP